jgi:predicted site-specific integrase-resolvase
MNGDSLPNRELLKISEVATFFDVSERSVRLWVSHGHLHAVPTPGGGVRIVRESVLSCFYAKRRRE